MKLLMQIFLIFLLTGMVLAQEDPRVIKLEKFMARYCPHSPLRGKGKDMVKWADQYGLDYRLYLALAGVESGWGKRFPKKSYNLTGIRNGKARFKSLSHNIQFTYATIGTKRWYRKYRNTKNLMHLIYVYKAVPPYQHYLRGMKYTLDLVSSMPATEEKKFEVATKPKTDLLLAFNRIRFDQFASRTTNTLSLTP
ncbi:MAG: hypothetical protein ACPL4K_01085 [Candidatus Margulisiibacteriota bacterium]